MQTFDLTGKQLKVLPPEREGKAAIQIVRMKFVPGDDKFLFCGVSSRGWAGVRDTAGVKPPTIIQDHTNTVMALNVTSDGLLAVSAGGDNNEIFVWSIRDGSIITKFQPASKGLWSVGWSQDGKTLAWGSTNRHRGDGICQTEMTFHLNDFLMGLPPQNQSDFNIHLRTEGDFSIKVNNFSQFTVSENGKELYQHNSRSDRIYSVSFMPGHGIIVGASGRIYLLDTKTGKLIREYFGDRGLTTAVTPSPNGRYFATASTDQVLRIWSPESSDPILSIFTVGREWIAWTPQGYYTCSATGERLIAWQVNNGIDRLPSVHPAARFHASLFQPALLKYLIPTGDLRLSLAMANKFEKQQIVATGLEDVLPPKVTIKAPDTANLKPITVKATAVGSDKNPIVSMKLLIDGRPYRGNAGVVRIDKKANAEATWEVALEGGSHTLAVIAESPVSKGMSQSVAVKSTAPILKPNLYILAIGVSQYPGALKLNYAASDALLLSSTLQKKSKSLFTNIEIRVITDKQATKSGIREGLDWLKEKMTTRDIGIVSFSGHGGRDEDTGKFYLIPVDAGPDFESTCLSGEELKTRLEDMPGRLVAILDACHSGSVTEIKPAKADNLVRDLVTDDCGVVVLASSLGSEFSLESSLTKAGLYTLGLTEGMNGRADFNRDGVVFINELSLYASIRVQQLSGGRQNPTIGRPPNIRPFAIAKP